VIRKSAQPSINLGSRFQPQLMVQEYISTRKGDAERGPLIRMRQSEARIRLLEDGELVWVQGPRRKEIAELMIDESIPEGRVVIRDIAGVAVTEYVTVTKPDLDNPPRQVG
jgi:uncharacterized protein involved in tellurium resistance